MSLDVAGPVCRPGPFPVRACLALAGAALILTLTAFAAMAQTTGNAQNGEELYRRCMGCHALDRNRTGPLHCGVVGSKAGTVEGFRYSEAMANSDIIWTPEELDRFLSDPMGTVPGTRMGYSGIKDPQVRADLIAFLLEAGNDPQRCP